MVFEPRNGLFKRLCTDAARDENRHFFLVVDEINRGDVPRIFGELITVIEHDKRNLPITLPLTGSSFFVPGIEYKISQVARFWLSQVTRQGRQGGHVVACRQAMAARLRAIVQRRSLRARLDLYGWLVLRWPK
jgi:5-methylcytosine-specific restriction endonuclease McrBC GTP-binding regulatory subunit McrB